MRLFIIVVLSLIWLPGHAQDVDAKVQLHSAYMPQFTVREASGSNVQPIGIRLTRIIHEDDIIYWSSH